MLNSSDVFNKIIDNETDIKVDIASANFSIRTRIKVKVNTQGKVYACKR